MKFIKTPELKRWTKAAIYCYERDCICSDCFYKRVMESECQMKDTVLALYRKFGKPKGRGFKMIRKQLAIINHYGEEAQLLKLVEEMEELKEAIVDKHKESHIIEEMADVLNVLQGLIYKKGCEEKIVEIQEEKLDRQLQRIYREEHKNKEEV